MADLGGTETHCVFVETNLETCVAIPLHDGESIPDFKQRLCKEHQQIFTETGEINISALKVKRRGQFYHLSDDSLTFAKVFEHTHKGWFLYADALSVEKQKRNKPSSVLTLEKPLVDAIQKEKDDVSVPTIEEEPHRIETAVVSSDIKNQDPARLNMGTVNTTSGEVQVGMATEKKKKRKRSSIKTSSLLVTDQSSNRFKMSRTLSKYQADATESKNSPSNDVEAFIHNPLDVNMNGVEAAYPSTDGVLAPTKIELNSATMEKAPPPIANETDALLTPSLLTKCTEVCDLTGNTLVLVGTIGSGLVESLLDHSNKQVLGNCEETIESKNTEKKKPCEDHKTYYMDEKKDGVSGPRNEEEQLETETVVVTSDGILNTTCGEVQVGVSAPPIENANETDAFFTPAKKKDTENIVVVDDSEDDSIYKQITKEIELKD